MTRHVKIVVAEAYDGDVETNTGTLAKKVYDIVNGKSAYTITAVPRGQKTAVIIAYDD